MPTATAKNAAGATPDTVSRRVIRALATIRDYPSQKFVGDSWFIVGICARSDPNGAGWNARGWGAAWLASAGAPRVKEITVSGGAAPVVVAPTSAQYAMRTIEQAWQVVGTLQNILPIAAIITDGTNARTGTDAFTTNSLLTFGAGVELGIFLACGRSLATGNGANPDTLHLQVDMQEVCEWLAAPGLMSAGRILNVQCLGDSITQGTGWNMDSLGELFGWRRKLEEQWISESGLPTLRYHGSNGGGVNNGHMVLGRHAHEGRSGFTSGQILTALPGYLAALTSVMDVVVLGLGTNDAQSGVTLATWKANMQAIIDAIHAHANAGANCKIVLSTIPPILNTTHEALAATYRVQLGTLTGVWQLVDDTTGINTTTGLSDGVHPNEATYTLMAQRRVAILRAA